MLSPVLSGLVNRGPVPKHWSNRTTIYMEETVALPQLTDEQRKAALEKAAEARKQRAELKA